MTQALMVHQSSFDSRQLDLIRKTVAKGTTPEQFGLFIEVCKHYGLNPFARQIYAVVRGTTMTIQTSIDGYRLIAERSGKYAGQIGPQWCGEDGEWKDVWLSDKPPAAARIGVLRKDFQQPTWGVAKYKSYMQASSPLWTKMPDVMLAKCAESLALRKAFPAEMAGIYTKEEMEQADTDVQPLHPTHLEETAHADDAEQVEGEVIEVAHPVHNQHGQTESLDSKIIKAKNRSRTLGIDNAEKWAALLDHLKLTEIKDNADLARVNGYLTNIEKRLAEQANATSGK